MKITFFLHRYRSNEQKGIKAVVSSFILLIKSLSSERILQNEKGWANCPLVGLRPISGMAFVGIFLSKMKKVLLLDFTGISFSFQVIYAKIYLKLIN